MGRFIQLVVSLVFIYFSYLGAAYRGKLVLYLLIFEMFEKNFI